MDDTPMCRPWRAAVRRQVWAGASVIMAILANAAGAHVIERVSVSSAGEQANRASQGSAISSDGRFIAFASFASNLVGDDRASFWDIFLRDRVLQTTVRVSLNSAGEEAAGDCRDPAISADGRFVSFGSRASNLVPDDTNGLIDIFVHNMTTGITRRVSVSSTGEQANGDSVNSCISADGRFVAFESGAKNLVPDDTNKAVDIFVHDLLTGETTRVNLSSEGQEADRPSANPSISADGRFIVFESFARNLVPDDTNGTADIFVRDRESGVTTRVSVASGGGEAHGKSQLPSISAEGRWVAFQSAAPDLVAGDTNEVDDVFLHDRVTRTTLRVSVDSSGGEGDLASGSPSVCEEGRFLVFQSSAHNLIPDQEAYGQNIYLHDAGTRTTIRLSSNPWGEPVSRCWYPCVSADGRFAAFESWSDRLVPDDTNETWDIFACETCPPSSWRNYGDGWPGTNGIPVLLLGGPPDLCGYTTLAIENSRGAETLGILFAGIWATEIPTMWDGTLLVQPQRAIVFMVPPSGAVWPFFISCDDWLCHTLLRIQVLELDPGASRGVSFSQGLELRIGH
ncbi:MAG: calcium-binding protein [Planctomycetota bacterium]